MKYKNKIKVRVFMSGVYVLIGVALIVSGCVMKQNTELISSFGTVFAVVGLIQMLRNIRLLRNPAAMEKREISESDERNVMIYEKARSLTFAIFSVLAGIAVVVLYIIGQALAGQIVAYTLCGLLIVYWMCYIIISKKY